MVNFCVASFAAYQAHVHLAKIFARVPAVFASPALTHEVMNIMRDGESLAMTVVGVQVDHHRWAQLFGAFMMGGVTWVSVLLLAVHMIEE